MKKYLTVLSFVLGVLVVVNLLFLDFWLFWKEKKTTIGLSGGTSATKEVELENKEATDCGQVCQQTITEKIAEEMSRLTSPAGSAGQSSVSPSLPAKVPAQLNGKPRVVYIPLVTDGSVSSVSWTDIIPSEFYFDLSNYPQAKEVRFEAYLLSSNNDLDYARLYDVTNKRGVDFSDLQTTSSTFTLVESSPMMIWQGNNKYTVQLRSVNGTQVQLKDARLKILY
ncbi:MAG: hypothetical protein ACPLY7_00395 [Microgenomates group bacterium]